MLKTFHKKKSKTVGILFKLNHMLPVPIFKPLYYALLYPYINYGTESWFGAPEHATNGVWVLQNRAVRGIYSLGCKEHTACYFKSNKFLKNFDLDTTFHQDKI